MVWGARSDTTRILRELLVSFQHDRGNSVSIPRAIVPRFDRLILQARLPYHWLRNRAILGVFGGVATLSVGGVALAGAFLVVFFVALYTRIRLRARANRAAIERDLPALLTTVASSVRAGMDPLSALLGARDYFPRDTLIVHEIERIKQGLHEGRDEEELLEGFLSLYGNRDGELFKGC